MTTKLPNEYHFSMHDIHFKLHSPWLESYERLEHAKRIIEHVGSTDREKLEKLFQIFSPFAYQLSFYTLKEVPDDNQTAD